MFALTCLAVGGLAAGGIGVGGLAAGILGALAVVVALFATDDAFFALEPRLVPLPIVPPPLTLGGAFVWSLGFTVPMPGLPGFDDGNLFVVGSVGAIFMAAICDAAVW